ncbi:hypothetical protein [Pseudonocardia sp. H11422]|uniref:hypothetical protein n=1 Tax=Pseudonocardia sp. H11422 TaxID=2835866 RepID=UPI001BDCCBC3|nr:hypothetical protein [Pseudonocardia sp. H11422]
MTTSLNTSLNTTISTPLSNRDRAVLRAVAAGRCEMPDGSGHSLMIDGLCCCDQFVGPRLAGAGLITAIGRRPGPAQLTSSGRAILEAA